MLLSTNDMLAQEPLRHCLFLFFVNPVLVIGAPPVTCWVQKVHMPQLLTVPVSKTTYHSY